MLVILDLDETLVYASAGRVMGVQEDFYNHSELIRNCGNDMYIRPFEGKQDDREFVPLQDYLLNFKSGDNVRRMEKRECRS